MLPGQTLTDALDPVAAAIGLTIDEVTGYLGHDDDGGTWSSARSALPSPSPIPAPSPPGRVGHRWWEDLDCPPAKHAAFPPR